MILSVVYRSSKTIIEFSSLVVKRQQNLALEFMSFFVTSRPPPFVASTPTFGLWIPSSSDDRYVSLKNSKDLFTNPANHHMIFPVFCPHSHGTRNDFPTGPTGHPS